LAQASSRLGWSSFLRISAPEVQLMAPHMCSSVLSPLLVSLLLWLGRAQDPATAMAVGVAGKMAGMAFDKARDTYEHQQPILPCTGDRCCQSSTCIKGVPGQTCHASRGPTECVGSSALQFHYGQCACLHGACSAAGTCGPLPEGWTPPATTQAPALRAAPAPAHTPSWLAQAAQPAPAAPQPNVAVPPGVPVGSSAPAPAPTDDDFLSWHTPSRLFEEAPKKELATKPGFAPPPLVWLGFAGLALVVGALREHNVRRAACPSGGRSDSGSDEEYLVSDR